MSDRTLSTWAGAAGFPQRIDDAELVHGWGDIEVAYGVRREGEQFAVVRQDRGQWSTKGRLDRLADADAFLLVCFGTVWRANRGLADVFPVQPAPGATITPTDAGYLAEVADSRGWFPLRSDAKRFTYVGGRTLAEVEAFLRAGS